MLSPSVDLTRISIHQCKCSKMHNSLMVQALKGGQVSVAWVMTHHSSLLLLLEYHLKLKRKGGKLLWRQTHYKYNFLWVVDSLIVSE